MQSKDNNNDLRYIRNLYHELEYNPQDIDPDSKNFLEIAKKILNTNISTVSQDKNEIKKTKNIEDIIVEQKDIEYISSTIASCLDTPPGIKIPSHESQAEIFFQKIRNDNIIQDKNVLYATLLQTIFNHQHSQEILQKAHVKYTNINLSKEKQLLDFILFINILYDNIYNIPFEILFYNTSRILMKNMEISEYNKYASSKSINKLPTQIKEKIYSILIPKALTYFLKSLLNLKNVQYKLECEKPKEAMILEKQIPKIRYLAALTNFFKYSPELCSTKELSKILFYPDNSILEILKVNIQKKKKKNAEIIPFTTIYDWQEFLIPQILNDQTFQKKLKEINHEVFAEIIAKKANINAQNVYTLLYNIVYDLNLDNRIKNCIRINAVYSKKYINTQSHHYLMTKTFKMYIKFLRKEQTHTAEYNATKR